MVTKDGPVSDGEVVGDELLRSVFRNVLTNAIQHNDKAVPTVSVAVQRADGTVVGEISNNRPGSPDEGKSAIFEHGEMGQVSEETGLSLYLVDTLVARHGRDVHIEDNDPEGAVFVGQLPLASPPSSSE